MASLKNAVIILEKASRLPSEYKPHKLSGKYSTYWEAHIQPDWLIIWKVFKDEKEVWLTRTGTHSDLF
jgi:mRNA interferase YafQ